MDIEYPPRSSGGAAYARWLTQHDYNTPNLSYTAGGAGRALFMVVDVPGAAHLDKLMMYEGGAGTANCRAYVYGPLVTKDTPVGAPLLAQSAEYTLLNSSGVCYMAFNNESIAAGQYMVAVQFSNGASTFYGASMNLTPDLNMCGYVSATYGSMPATISAITQAFSAPIMFLGLK